MTQTNIGRYPTAQPGAERTRFVQSQEVRGADRARNVHLFKGQWYILVGQTFLSATRLRQTGMSALPKCIITQRLALWTGGFSAGMGALIGGGAMIGPTTNVHSLS